MKIILTAGARPNFMKIAPLVHELRKDNRGIEWKLVHTGQHYDFDMAQVFFEELEIPKPDHFLNAGSGTHAEQTAKVMIEFEKVCLKEKPDIIVVVGDVNSTLACSIVGKKQNIIVAHVEAGLRSGDLTMPEEINRMVTDSISDLLFVSEKSGLENLKKEGKRDNQVFFVGNIMIDTLYYQLNKLNKHNNTKSGKNRISASKPYGVVTLHRPSNVDEKIACRGIIEALSEISENLPIVFPVHPRTKKNLESFGLMKLIDDANIKLPPPLPYTEFLKLWKDAEVVFTDSGGIQEETTALGVPCFTIRENTERPITIEEGTNTLVGNKKEDILRSYADFRNGNYKQGKVPHLWDGKTAGRIIKHIIGQS